MARIMLTAVLLAGSTTPIAPVPPGAGSGGMGAGTELASSPRPNLFLEAAQPDSLLPVDAAPAPMASTAATELSAPMAPQTPEPFDPTDAVLAALRNCESGGNYTANTGNGFFGAVQWLRSTWDAAAARAGRHDLVGVAPDAVAPSDQDEITRFWWNHSDPLHEWPTCGPRALRAAS